MDPCSIRGKGTLKWRFMKNKELKSDAVAERIVSIFGYIRKNLYMFIGLICISILALWWVNRTLHLFDSSLSEEENIKARMASDKIMLELINQGANNSDYINNILTQKIDSIYTLYPDSDNIGYLGFMLSKENENLYKDNIDIMKNNIENDWFKTQAFLISGDYYSDNEDLNKAKEDYEKAIKYSATDTQKAYSNYKLGNIYFELDNFEYALSAFEKADELFQKSKQNQTLNRNQQFNSWVERNTIALNKIKNIFKK